METLTSGNIVYLLDEEGNFVLDHRGDPYLYQIVSVYYSKIGLVTSDGEYVGMHPIGKIVYKEEGPIFKKEDYQIGTEVVWIDGEDIYEGTILELLPSTARLHNIKKLLPVNHRVRLPYWKIPDGRIHTPNDYHKRLSPLNKRERSNMSTKANIVIRNDMNTRKEIFLYQHSDAHPNNLTLILAERLREIYFEFKELGDIDWFLNPSKLASFLLIKSVPTLSDEAKELMKLLPESSRYHLESQYFLGMPTLLIENSRVSNCNYEYIITTSENVEEEFFGYELEINKLNNNKLISTVMKHKENIKKQGIKNKKE